MLCHLCTVSGDGGATSVFVVWYKIKNQTHICASLAHQQNRWHELDDVGAAGYLDSECNYVRVSNVATVRYESSGRRGCSVGLTNNVNH